MIWTPRVTVAAIIEQHGKFLMVEEDKGPPATAFNQPAGHLEAGESLQQAVVREVQEETGYQFIPRAVTGIYRWIAPSTGDTYLRVCFCGEAGAHDPQQPLDDGIIAAHWLGMEQVAGLNTRLRSPLVTRCLNDYHHGRRFPLELLVEL